MGCHHDASHGQRMNPYIDIHVITVLRGEELTRAHIKVEVEQQEFCPEKITFVVDMPDDDTIAPQYLNCNDTVTIHQPVEMVAMYRSKEES